MKTDLRKQLAAALLALAPLAVLAADEPSAPRGPCIPEPRPESHAHQWNLFREDLAEIQAHGANGYDLVLFGDSITDNWNWMAREALDSLGTGWGRVFNMGIGGDRTENLLWRLDNGALDGYTAKYFNVLIGTNNSFQKTPCDKPEEIAAAIRMILDRILAKHPESKVFLMPILPYQMTTNPQGAVRRANNEAVNAIIVGFADNKRVFWVDVREQLVNADGSCKGEMYSEKNLDGFGHCLHPSPKAYKEVLVPALKEAMARLDAGKLPTEKPVFKPLPAAPGAAAKKAPAPRPAPAPAAAGKKAEKPGEKLAEKKVAAKPAAVSAAIGWTAEPMSESGDTIRTDGTLVYAYAKGDYTVNTVPFRGLGEVNLDDVAGSVPFRVDTGMYRQIDEGLDDYDSLLRNHWVGEAGKRVLTLKGLEKGRTYLVQLVLHGKSDGASATAPNGARAQSGGEGWPRGGSLVGVFTADAEAMAFALTTIQWTTLNAIQVRELPAE
ncbi:MAG: hypothetical protein II839_00505 [Kiritimatiellae bacterium]|nr:hypothetical protein [Kiritimatiellia bacterium]